MPTTPTKRILLTGGGTGGHITPNIALIEHLRSAKPHWELSYMGSHQGMERTMLPEDLPYIPVSTGKLRRYWSWENIMDMGRVSKGIWEARRHLKTHRPDVIFAKGGYVSIPAIMAGASLGIPIVLHESDVIPGLATKVGARFAHSICSNFPQTAPYLPGKKVITTGLPLRHHFSQASTQKGLELTGFTKELPILLVMGGSQGSQLINTFVWDHLRLLLPHMQIVHIVGAGKLRTIDWNRMFLEELAALIPLNPSSNHAKDHVFQQELQKRKQQQYLDGLTARYRQFQFLNEEFPHILATSQVVLTRSGATTIMELAKMQKPAVLVPLGRSQSRGDQIKNAEVLDTQGAAITLTEEELRDHPTESIALLTHLLQNKDRQEVLKQRIRKFHYPDGAERITQALERAMG